MPELGGGMWIIAAIRWGPMDQAVLNVFLNAVEAVDREGSIIMRPHSRNGRGPR
jgi:hypothetical protein